jgi:hypothetical protein
LLPTLSANEIATIVLIAVLLSFGASFVFRLKRMRPPRGKKPPVASKPKGELRDTDFH